MPAGTTSSPPSAVGAALALAEVADELGLTVALLGTPAEESGGGKVLLLNAGAFDDIAAAVMVHPGPIDIARRTVAGVVRSRGDLPAAGNRTPPSRRISGSTPPTRSPSRRWRSGCCASNWRRASMVHGIVTDGGQAHQHHPGARRHAVHDARRPSRSRCASWRSGWRTASRRARWRPGCDYEIDETAPPYAELTPDTWLADAFRAEMLRLGRSPVPAESRPRCRWAAPTWATSPR